MPRVAVPRVAVVTGAAQNLGAAIALGLAGRGLNVVINTRTKVREAQKVVDRAQAMGVRALAVQADVTDPGAVERMFDEAAELGPLGALVNNAAVRSVRPLAELDLAEWRAVHAVIADGAFNCIRAALPRMRRAGGGRIVNILGGRALDGDPDRVHVAAAKHALLGLTIAAARACARDHVTVNAVSPHATRMTDPVDLQRWRLRVAEAVCLLAAGGSDAVTGQVVTVDDDETALIGDADYGVPRTGGGESVTEHVVDPRTAVDR